MSAVCLESSRARNSLKLPLNRSLSEPGSPTPTHLFLSPPKRFKLESASVSLPTSPCAESATIQRNAVLKQLKTIDADGLKQKLESCRTMATTTTTTPTPRFFIVLDCRAFISYNMSHIVGAINVNCSDRFNRRRLQQGKASLADLATTREGKELLKKRTYREVIVYDDNTCDKERVNATHPLMLVLTALVEDNREPVLLLGKYCENFSFYYSEQNCVESYYAEAYLARTFAGTIYIRMIPQQLTKPNENVLFLTIRNVGIIRNDLVLTLTDTALFCDNLDKISKQACD